MPFKIPTILSVLLLSFGVNAYPQSTGRTSEAPAVPLGTGRPETPGVTRTAIRDDSKSSVVRVRFIPGAKEPPHTHPYDVILVPVTVGSVDFNIAGTTVKAFAVGGVQFIPRDTPHHLTNLGTEPLEFITVAIK
jgi:quercetin dioxygenase-like cupin family protein